MRASVIGVLLAAVVVGVGAGCILFTGGTEGYALMDSGASSCSSAAECEAGSVCCLIVSAATTSTAGTCAASCAQSYPQLCTTTPECGDAGACTKQSCTIDGGEGISVPLQACGLLPLCKATP
jgi:hypothetical protein